MKRLASLFLLLAPFAACTVGNVPDGEDIPDGVTCEKKVTGTNHGHHYSGMTCLAGGACHPTAAAASGPPYLPLNGTVYEKSDGMTLVEGATVTITWAGGSKKYVSSGGAGASGGQGNILEYAENITDITFPATVKVSLCPTQEKAMNTQLANLGDLNCARAGCHDSNLRIYIK